MKFYLPGYHLIDRYHLFGKSLFVINFEYPDFEPLRLDYGLNVANDDPDHWFKFVDDQSFHRYLTYGNTVRYANPVYDSVVMKHTRQNLWKTNQIVLSKPISFYDIEFWNKNMLTGIDIVKCYKYFQSTISIDKLHHNPELISFLNEFSELSKIKNKLLE